MIINSGNDIAGAIANLENDPIIEIPSGKLYAWTGEITTPWKLIINEGSRFFINGQDLKCDKGVSESCFNGYDNGGI